MPMPGSIEVLENDRNLHCIAIDVYTPTEGLAGLLDALDGGHVVGLQAARLLQVPPGDRAELAGLRVIIDPSNIPSL